MSSLNWTWPLILRNRVVLIPTGFRILF